MKLIIEIPEQGFSACKLWVKNRVATWQDEIIANGIPITEGDAISRKALVKSIEEIEDNYDGYEPHDLGKFMNKVYDIIDNAPSVGISE